MLAGPNDKVRVLTVVLALARARGLPESLPGPLPQILIRNPGEPGSKPFPGFVSSNSLDLPQPALVGLSRTQLNAVEKPAKISPVKRTRLRSRDNKKIVLKRRKVKRLRARPRPEPDGVSLAPEAQRGGSLAELALATLSAEELSAETGRDHQNDATRDIQIMKITKNRNRENSLTFPSRVKVALKKEILKKDTLDTRLAGSSKSSDRLSIKAIRKNIFDPRKRLKGIKKGFRDRLHSPDSEESTTLPNIIPQSVVSPFPNFPMRGQTAEAIVTERPQEVRGGRAETETEVEIPNIGFEELTLTPGKTEIDLSSETFIPILRGDNKSNQMFPALASLPDNKQTLPLHTKPVTPVKGQPLPISQFLDYGDAQEPEPPNTPALVNPANFETKFENFPSFPVPVTVPVPSVENRPGLTSLRPGIPSVPNTPPFPDIFNNPRPPSPNFPPLPAVTTPLTTTPQPIFQDPPLLDVEEPKSHFPPLPPVASPSVSDAGKMTRHSETVVGNSVLGHISYVDTDGAVKQLSYKKPAPPTPPPPPPPPAANPVLQPLLPAFLSPVRPPVPPSHLLPEVPQPREPPLNIRHHGSTVVPRLKPTPAPVRPVQPSTQPHLASPVTTQSAGPTPFIHHHINHSDKPARLPQTVRHSFFPSVHPDIKTTPARAPPPAQPSSVILPTFTPLSPQFEPHPPLLPPVPPPFRPHHFPSHSPATLTSTLPPPVRPQHFPAHKPSTLTSTLPPPVRPHHFPGKSPPPVTSTLPPRFRPHHFPGHNPPFRPPHSPVHKIPSLTFFPAHHSPPPPPTRPQLVSTTRPASLKTSSASLPPRPTPAGLKVTEHYPSPSPVPAIWQPRGALFTPKPFVHIHTTVVPIVLRSSPPPQPQVSSTSSPGLVTPQRFTTPHPNFFTTPYPQTPYPPLKYPGTRAPAHFLLPHTFPYNGHGVPAHVSRVGTGGDLVTAASDLQRVQAAPEERESEDTGVGKTTDHSERRASKDEDSKRFTTSRNYRLGFDPT